MSMHTFNVKTSYNVEIISAVCGISERFALTLCDYVEDLRLYNNYKLTYSLPRISYRTNLFQQHTCRTF